MVYGHRLWAKPVRNQGIAPRSGVATLQEQPEACGRATPWREKIMRQTIVIVAAMPEERDALLARFPASSTRRHFHCTRFGMPFLILRALSDVPARGTARSTSTPSCATPPPIRQTSAWSW